MVMMKMKIVPAVITTLAVTTRAAVLQTMPRALNRLDQVLLRPRVAQMETLLLRMIPWSPIIGTCLAHKVVVAHAVLREILKAFWVASSPQVTMPHPLLRTIAQILWRVLIMLATPLVEEVGRGLALVTAASVTKLPK
jgi:hypothetical protein